MKITLKILVFFLLSVFIISCEESGNPSKIQSNNEWNVIKEFDELDNTLIHFFNEDEGIIAGSVYYGKAIFEGAEIVVGFGNDTTQIIMNKLIDSSLVVKPVLWKTYDGGKNWTPKGNFISSVIDMKFIDDLNGFLIAEGQGVYKTVDGGENWFRIMGAEIRFWKPNRMFPYISVPKEVEFFDADNGIILMSNTENGNVSLITNDGGFTWEFNSFTNKVENVIFPSKYIKIGYANSYDSIVKSKDGGLTWNSVRESKWYNPIAFLDHENWVVHEDHKLFWTSDGGILFNQVFDFEDFKSNLQFSLHIDKIIFRNNLCYIISDYGGIGVSADSCRSFKLIPAQNLPTCDYSFPSENVFYAVHRGLVYKYVNND